MADEPRIEPAPLESPPSTPPASPVSAAPPSPPLPPQEESWKDKRIDTLTAQKADLRRQIEELQTKVTATPPPPPVDRAAITEQVRTEERQRLMMEQFNARCNEVAQAGRVAFPDFDSKVQALGRLVDRADPQSIAAYNNLVSATLEAGDPAKTFYEIASDLNEASRLLALNPVRMGMEVAKRGGIKTERISSAPPPIRPIDGRSTPLEIDPTDADRSDTLSTQEWMRRRNAQLAKSAGAR